MIPGLRMVTISFTPEQVAERAAEVQLPVGERIDDPTSSPPSAWRSSRLSQATGRTASW